ncbi:Phosphoglycerate mutase 2 [Folsomia candida]|uniref:Phosphoglycerate mutase n=1 Tax=Folsomia candida TaxID=158441 RepID=A0A226DSX6_FOLCA|nr:Phosphoglycerate mutase 2 [Folsomia candida]
MATYKIVMVRHGESEWNQRNLFCGWYDAKLSVKAHTSQLTRAHITLASILAEIGQADLPTHKTWRLNERHYGGLTGLNKAETVKKYGEEQVQIWRRSFNVPPPPITEENKYYRGIVDDDRYSKGPKGDEFPTFETLKLTIDRTLPYWNDVILPQIKESKQILIVAHGTSLRGLVKHLNGMSDQAIMGINLPTGVPFVYELDEYLKPVVSMRFLGDEETVEKAMAIVTGQLKTK